MVQKSANMLFLQSNVVYSFSLTPCFLKQGWPPSLDVTGLEEEVSATPFILNLKFNFKFKIFLLEHVHARQE